MISNKLKTIEKVVNFFQKNYSFHFNNLDKKIDNIIKSTDFDLLKKNEIEFGFPETVGKNFFRKGTSNQWKHILTKDQVLSIEKKFYPLMKKIGYKIVYYNK